MSLDFIQDQVYDTFGALYPGQIADFGSAQNENVRTYVNETRVVPAEGVVKGDPYDISDPSYAHIRSPYPVKAAESGSVDADFVGMVVRTQSFIIDDETNTTYRPAKQLITIAERGSGMIIGANTPVAIAHGDPVFMSIDETQAPSLPVGSFTNTDGAGVIELTGLSWYGASSPGSVGRIKL
ncbi:hypothetical protein F9L16_23630 [Agarivorans sp. B2Z047]|uniref:structural cement protein Gp24 n=1 Tax=Agarivorans sp. B2Z047 TaxID=2652721 RepID=UPI00128E1F48|nr:hypothetical protein [Agarivorans sp. B2Z047]MPW31949.1 hypothetical protein [Agarivorans sp. B2Z047]UQN41886.1 hypothetical protein LQZ07_19220 [Agarivorans sp. B2Z047]UQN44881.1 hypothetical protein LQZ07_10575 [Agarivorans sp. B2Z047]